MSGEFPRRGRLAGVDFGSVRIGIAVTDADQRLASPLEIFRRRGQAAEARFFQELARREQICGFVVGLPVHTSGRESEKSRQAREFASWLEQVTGLPVRLFDERYTTVEAESALRVAGMTKRQRRARLDKLAAQMLLAAFLESSRRDEPPAAIGDEG
jgi:putative Holliday junction resolvase